MEERPGLTRRELLRRGAVGGAALALGGPLLACSKADATAPRVVIVGAGLAGLSCAYRLHLHGVGCTVYEANPDRIGGRCWTARDFAGGQTAEHGGEFIDTRHRRMRALAKEFGLELTDLYALPNPGSPRLWLNDALRRRTSLRAERAIFIRRLTADARRVRAYTARNHTRAAIEFDRHTVAEWLDANIPGGAASPLGQLVWSDLASEFGLDADRLSALNLFYEYVESTPGADERFHVRGGNDQIPHAMADALPDGTVHQGTPLEALFERGDGSYGMRFGGVAGDVVADRVVLAIPFTTLRRVDLGGAGLSRFKRRMIRDLGMGTNAKVLIQFSEQPKDYGRWNSFLYSDAPFLTTWNSTLGQPGRSSILTTFYGGRSGAGGLDSDGAHGPTTRRQGRRTLASLTQGGRMLLPGLAAGLDGPNGHSWTDHWSEDPWARGSYAAFLPGQYTKYYGIVGEPEGGIHFAGEQTATDNQGYLEGAVESGERCAEEIMRA